jgi:pimeloyl-ACP methyl ester carboxylesterase
MDTRNEVEGFLEGHYWRIWYDVHGTGSPGIPLPVLYGGPGAPFRPESFCQSRLPSSEMVIFEDASHEYHLEKPEEFLTTARGFLNRIE